MGRIYGYARVSTPDQDPALQLDALVAAGCERIWTEQASGRLTARPALAELLATLDVGDTLAVWKLDRLGRSLADLVATVGRIEAAGAGRRSLTDQIDTTTPAGRLTFGVFAALAEFEAELIRERTLAGLAAARSRGRRFGRPRVMSEARVKVARQMLADGSTITEVARALGVSRASIYRYATEI